MNLFVDDQRIPPEGWELTRTITESIRILASEKIKYLSLDHDIQWVPSHKGTYARAMSAESFEPVARFVVLLRKADQPEIIFIHTANPNGGSNLTRILSSTASKIIRISPVDPEIEIQEFLKRHELRKPKP